MTRNIVADVMDDPKHSGHENVFILALTCVTIHVREEMKKIVFQTILVLAVVQLASPAPADTLALMGGDKLSGNLVEISEGTLVFRSTLAGLVVVPVDEVVWVATAPSYRVKLRNGESLTGHFTCRDEATHFALAGGEGSRLMDLADVEKVTRFETDVQKLPPIDESPRLTGLFGAGAYYRWADRETIGLVARLEVARQTEDYAFSSLMKLSLTGGDRFPEYLETQAEWAFLTPGNVHPEIVLSLERDVTRGLEARTAVGGGLTWAPFDDPDHLRLSSGLEAVWERSDADLLRSLHDYEISALESTFHRWTRFRYFGKDGGEVSEEQLSLYLRLRHQSQLFGSVMFSEDLQLHPSLTELGDLRARSESALAVPLTPRLSLRLQLQLDYESEPAFREVDRWNTSVGAGLTVGF